MELLHADEYIACIKAGKKPRMAIVGTKLVSDGMVTDTGKYFLVIGGFLYEVKASFTLYVQWEQDTLRT
jgi:hypothetical protein